MQMGCTLCSPFCITCCVINGLLPALFQPFIRNAGASLLQQVGVQSSQSVQLQNNGGALSERCQGDEATGIPFFLLILQAQHNQTLSFQHWVMLITRLKAVILRGTIRSWSAVLKQRHCSFFSLHFTPRAVTQNPLVIRKLIDSYHTWGL